jgi:O-antigen biosynthesis protein WbqP
MLVSRNDKQNSVGTYPLKRLGDIVLGVLITTIAFIPMVLTAIFIKLTSKGPALYWSKRVGKNNEIFHMPKFRTMYINTPQVATHLLADPKKYLILGGSLIRKLSLDELPQLYSVLVGDMSLVGPRPALFNQDDLIALRTAKGIHQLKPGVTGWAQINGRDELSIPKKVEVDEYYLHHISFELDLKIIVLTIVKVLGMKGVSH